MPDQTAAAGSPQRRAVVYLRVSTPRQMDTARDVDPDGNSIATQRQLCGRKALSVDATIVKEFVEPGNSAQTIEKRPVFREMLKYLGDNPGIDYVIIYMRSRAFRNLGDAVITKRKLEQAGIKLVSAKENFGEGYMADAMEAVTDIFNEIEVRRNGEDISQKLEHKARNGGTIGRAKIGYLNSRVDVDGRLVNSISVDPERAPLVREAFRLYATGDFTIDALIEEMADRGLRTRASRTRPAKPVSREGMRMMLRDPYYIGALMYKGELIPHGRHEQIIDRDLWDRVQAVIEDRSRPGTRERVLRHHLKGRLFCGRCQSAGRSARLLYTEAKGRTGEYYGYFKCRGRQLGICDLPHLPVDQVEEAIELHYEHLGIGENFAAAMEQDLQSFVNECQQLTREMHDKFRRQLAALDEKEDRLIDLATDGAISRAKLQQRINTLRLERERVRHGLENTGAELQLGAARLVDAVKLVSNPAQLYAQASDAVRSTLNATFFERFYVNEGDFMVTVSGSDLKEPFDAIRRTAVSGSLRSVLDIDKGLTPRVEARAIHNIPVIFTRLNIDRLVDGSTKTGLVGADGFEPPTARV